MNPSLGKIAEATSQGTSDKWSKTEKVNYPLSAVSGVAAMYAHKKVRKFEGQADEVFEKAFAAKDRKKVFERLGMPNLALKEHWKHRELMADAHHMFNSKPKFARNMRGLAASVGLTAGLSGLGATIQRKYRDDPNV